MAYRRGRNMLSPHLTTEVQIHCDSACQVTLWGCSRGHRCSVREMLFSVLKAHYLDTALCVCQYRTVRGHRQGETYLYGVQA